MLRKILKTPFNKSVIVNSFQLLKSVEVNILGTVEELNALYSKGNGEHMFELLSTEPDKGSALIHPFPNSRY